ncbi:MAG: hypothetical protein JRG75_03195 [Deltaproteobacteria bacterium]|nr:hypothetical protein [Deltaproteobacteria bacterium]
MKEIIIGLKGRVGLFQKIRIATPNPVERQCGLEIHHRTAPKESATAKDAFPACPVLDDSGQGAFHKQVRIFDAALLKETYMALPALFSKH